MGPKKSLQLTCLALFCVTQHGCPCGCSASRLAARFAAGARTMVERLDGDQSKEHDRPESQCFLCNPKLADKLAAEYEVKYGKKPPKPEEK